MRSPRLHLLQRTSMYLVRTYISFNYIFLSEVYDVLEVFCVRFCSVIFFPEVSLHSRIIGACLSNPRTGF